LDGAIKFVRLGREDIKQKDMEGAHYNLSKAQDIVMELDESLDMDYDISQSLSGIYEFIYRQLIEANIKKDIKTLDQVELFLCDLKDTWVEALKTARKAEVQYGGK
jgi:flagellar protein FliS